MSYASSHKKQEELDSVTEPEQPDALLAAIGYDHTGWVAAPQWYADEKHDEFLKSKQGKKHSSDSD